MTPSTDFTLRETDERLAPLAFVYLSLVVSWIFAAIAFIFYIRG